MNDAELLLECKKGLGYQEDTTAVDGQIMQKLLLVKGFMIGAGVPEAKLSNPLAVGTIVLGVSDLWNVKSGEVKFSSVFYTFVTQLAAGGGTSEA